MIKRLKNAIAFYKIAKESPAILKVVTDIFKFVENAHKEQKPLYTQIVILNMADGEKLGDFVSLWAGIGEGNPIDRCRQLKAQNTALKEFLDQAIKGDLKDGDLAQALLVLKAFE